MSLLCQVYRSARKPETYLYVPKATGLQEVPQALLDQFGDAEVVLTLLLSAERKLARVSASDVLAAIDSQGFYLQMPPTSAELQRREDTRG